MRHFVVVGSHSIDHVLRFAAAAQNVRADEGVRAFDFVVHGLADVVKQSGPFGGGDVEAHFRGHHGHEMGDFDGMFQHVLRKAVADSGAAPGV